ncbi:hypothetical protein ACO0QE_003778 [Hanseniaspora vineae]
MVVLVASLFLPFKPQFEIDASMNEAAALLESQNIKIPAANPNTNTSSNANPHVGSAGSAGSATATTTTTTSNVGNAINENATSPELISRNRTNSSSLLRKYGSATNSRSPSTVQLERDTTTPTNTTNTNTTDPTNNNNNNDDEFNSAADSSTENNNNTHIKNRSRSKSQLLQRTNQLETDTKAASDAFMESLTANATNSAVETPRPSNTIAGMSNTSLASAAAAAAAAAGTSSQHQSQQQLHQPIPNHHHHHPLSKMHQGVGKAEFSFDDSSSDIATSALNNTTTGIPNLNESGTPVSLMQLQLGGGLTTHSVTPTGLGSSSSYQHLAPLSSQQQQQQTQTQQQQQQQIQHHPDRLDPTAALLKNVSKNLAGSSSGGMPFPGSSSPSTPSSATLGGNKFVPPRPSHLSTVITPKSRDLPASEQSALNSGKFRDMSSMPSTTSMRRVHRTSSSATPLQTPGSSLHLDHTQKTGIKEEENGDANNGVAKAAKKKFTHHHDYSLESLDHEVFFSDDELPPNALEGAKDGNDQLYLDNEVPEFGGYSNATNLVKTSLLGGSQNIFSKATWEIVTSHKCNAGLKNAVNTAILEKTFNQEIVWVGSIGIPTDALPDDVLGNVTTALDSDFHCKTVVADDITFKGAYKNFCKEILWPTFHYQIPDNPKSKAFEDHSWNHYQRLNQLYADKIVESYHEGDTIWVHDYHLLLVPGMIRAKLPHAKIGFSLHVSFPSSEVFRCFAQRKHILRGLLGANTVGFQTEEYARHFILTCNRLLMTDGDIEDGIKYDGRVIEINTTPIGIDAFNLQTQLQNESVSACRQLIRDRWGKDKYIIVSKDQFDSLRGLKNKFLAYERFLKTHPHYIKKCCFIQVFNGSAIKDLDLERDIVNIVDRINSLSEDISLSTQNVVFLHQQLEQSQYLALLSEADMFLVNSMREGMNLTCHDFIVCTQEKNSPLLISEFTGSAELLKRGCLLINPWDIRRVSEMIKFSLEMGAEEKRRKWKRMMKQIIINDSDNWIISMIKAINASWELNKQSSTLFKLNYPEVYSSYTSCKTRNKLFILKISQPPNGEVLKMLNDLCVHNEVYVLNSFDKATVERYYARVNNLNLIAENGAFVRIHGYWYTIMSDCSWTREVLPLLQSKLERLPGSYIKSGESMFRVHTENAEDPERVDDVVGDLILHINTLFGSRKGIHAYFHKNIVFVQQYGLSMKALKFIFNYYASHAGELHSVTSNASNGLMSPMKTPSLQRQGSSQSGGYFMSRGDSNNSLSSLNADDMKLRPKMSPTPSFDNIATLNSSQVGMVVDDKRGVNKFSFACITGSSSPVIEPLFKYINSLKRDVSYTFTCVYGNPSSTNAKQHVDGCNDLVNILSQLCAAVGDN